MSFPTTQIVSRTGQHNNQGDSRAGFLKLFSGEVLTAHRSQNIALSLTRKRTIKEGKSKVFPMIGRNTAYYHKPGDLIQASRIPGAERTITIDDVAVAPVFIADIDEAMNHFDVRKEYSFQNGEALSDIIDYNIFRMVAKAGLIASVEDMKAAGLMPIKGQIYTEPVSFKAAGDELDGQKIYDAIFEAKSQLDRKKLKAGKFVCVLPPDQYNALLKIKNIDTSPWMHRDVGGGGSVSQGVVPTIGGIRILMSANLPSENETEGLIDTPEPLLDTEIGSGNQAKYRGDYSKVVGIIFADPAVGTLERWNITSKIVDEPLRFGTTLLSYQLVGHDIIEPEFAITLLKQ